MKRRGNEMERKDVLEDENAQVEALVQDRVERLAKDWILFLCLSFFGWLWETILLSAQAGEWVDRGFLFLPICPIYGVTLMTVYFLLGTPKEGRHGLQKIQKPVWRYAAYLFFAFLLPSIAELAVGAFYQGFFGVRLWDYSTLPLNIMGFVSLPISLAWSVLITLFMRFGFMPIRNFVQTAKRKPAMVFFALSALAVFIDTVYQFAMM